MDPHYDPQKIESKWQAAWEQQGVYVAAACSVAEDASQKPKYYCLNYFPYPSGDGLHVGHCRNYIPTDVLSRYMRMGGYNVLHPMGWDAFGEPTEQAAIQHGLQPRQVTDRNTQRFRHQLTIIGNGYDWSREIDSSEPEYYRWTQWFFLLLYRSGLAYRDANWQWWCPACQTTMSSHEVEGGVCWRGHTGITKKEIPAWYFKITDYADALLDGLEEIDWPANIKTLQRNWIGRSEGAEIDFRTEDGEVIPVFTTRPDTVYGVTFFVLAPEHPLVEKLTSTAQRAAVEAYAAQAVARSEIERTAEGREKTGVFTGGYVINPANQARVPVWIADYVLPTYSTGAVMAVPAHDQRDFEFAQKYALPVQVVIAPEEYTGGPLEAAFEGEGKMIHSGRFDGTPSPEGISAVTSTLEAQGDGRAMVNYRMRDWLISRQRYWGAPIPIVHCPDCGEVPVPEDQLPVLLPEMDDFQPDGSGRSPLARVPEFVHTTCPECGGPAERETDTMGGFACSSWYFLRFPSPHEDQYPFDPEALRYWAPVDLYVGGPEHAVLHLMYARFWTKVMHDAGLIDFDEPFPRLTNQGILHGTDGSRMSKSRGNVVTPDAMVEAYGADALRLYEMFMAPFDQDVDWNEDGINGTRRFLNRLWRLFADSYAESGISTAEDPDLERQRHRLIRDITERVAEMRFNTMVSTFMECINALVERKQTGAWRTKTFEHTLETILLLLAPAAPHITEELWQQTGHAGSIHLQAWPEWDPEMVREEMISMAVQVNGKTRDVIEVSAQAGDEVIEAQAVQNPQVQRMINGKHITRIITIPGKVVNIVVK
jgi:leucyl-tRNA synthetase